MRRLLPLLITLMIVASCGKDSSSNPNPGRSGQNGNTPQPEEACLTEDCATITTDGSSTDLLDSLIDAPVEISASEIHFTVGKISVVKGDKITCKTEVRAGEVYQYALTGNNLQLQTGAGTYTMTRLNEGGTGILGTWMWKGKGEQGMHNIKTMSVVSNTRVILKNHCEL